MKNINFNLKGVVLGIILLTLVVGGFVFIPSLFGEKSTPIDYTLIQRESIPEGILDMMDEYVNEERALAVKLEDKIYVIATRGNDNNLGIQIDKISFIEREEKNVMKVEVTYKSKEESQPYIVVETNLTSLPDAIELETKKAE
ncbi:MAG: hypothetical protein R3Y64_07090 [Peptostreptococcaceae bacterium]